MSRSFEIKIYFVLFLRNVNSQIKQVPLSTCHGICFHSVSFSNLLKTDLELGEVPFYIHHLTGNTSVPMLSEVILRYLQHYPFDH